MTLKTDPLLKIGLIGNAAFSLATGLLLIAASTPMARWLGVPRPEALLFIGFSLLPFGLHLLLAVRRKTIRPAEIYFLSSLDALWVLASLAILILGTVPFTGLGQWLFAIVALCVADFMLLQIIGLRRTLKRGVPTG